METQSWKSKQVGGGKKKWDEDKNEWEEKGYVEGEEEGQEEKKGG